MKNSILLLILSLGALFLQAASIVEQPESDLIQVSEDSFGVEMTASIEAVAPVLTYSTIEISDEANSNSFSVIGVDYSQACSIDSLAAQDANALGCSKTNDSTLISSCLVSHASEPVTSIDRCCLPGNRQEYPSLLRYSMRVNYRPPGESYTLILQNHPSGSAISVRYKANV